MTSTPTPFLSFPSPSPDVTPSSSSSHTQDTKKTLLKDRLYVGNLHPTVDEYTLLTLFSKYGTITSLDFLFHKTGPSRGKPRGFAFVEFAEQAPAQKALQSLHDKLLRGRKLVVTYAHQAPPDPFSAASSAVGVERGGGGRYRRGMMDSGKPTTLSLLKSGRGDGPNPKDKIALMEAKLRQMESSSSSLISSTSAHPSTPTTSTSSTTTTTAAHPSLPPKPPPPTSTPTFSSPHSQSQTQTQSSGPTSKHKHTHQPLPSLPILPKPKPDTSSSSYHTAPSGTIPGSTPTGLNANTTANKDKDPSNAGGNVKPGLPRSGSGSGSMNASAQGRSSLGLAGVKIVKRDR